MRLLKMAKESKKKSERAKEEKGRKRKMEKEKRRKERNKRFVICDKTAPCCPAITTVFRFYEHEHDRSCACNIQLSLYLLTLFIVPLRVETKCVSLPSFSKGFVHLVSLMLHVEAILARNVPTPLFG